MKTHLLGVVSALAFGQLIVGCSAGEPEYCPEQKAEEVPAPAPGDFGDAAGAVMTVRKSLHSGKPSCGIKPGTRSIARDALVASQEFFGGEDQRIAKFNRETLAYLGVNLASRPLASGPSKSGQSLAPQNPVVIAATVAAVAAALGAAYASLKEILGDAQKPIICILDLNDKIILMQSKAAKGGADDVACGLMLGNHGLRCIAAGELTKQNWDDQAKVCPKV